MTITIQPAGYIPFQDEEVPTISIETIKEHVKAERNKTLKKIQEESIVKPISVKTSPPVKPSKSSKSEKVVESKKQQTPRKKPNLYGTDPDDPKNAAFFAELEVIRNSDPGLYKKITSMN